MADNYLEKRYAEVFGGQGSSRQGPRKPSLDTLLSKCTQAEEFDPEYTVHPLQVQAVLSVLQRMEFLGVRDKVGATPVPGLAAIDLTCHQDSLMMGAALQAMALKATELGLSCRLENTPDKDTLRLLLGRVKQP